MHGLDIIIRRNHEAAGREAAAAFRDGDYREANRIASIEADMANGPTIKRNIETGVVVKTWGPFIDAYDVQREADEAQYGKYPK